MHNPDPDQWFNIQIRKIKFYRKCQELKRDICLANRHLRSSWSRGCWICRPERPNDDGTLKIMMVRVRVFSSLNFRRYMYLISCNNLFQVIGILCIFLESFANITWLTLGTILITLALTNNVKTGPIIEFFSKDKQPKITCIVWINSWI